MSVRHPRAIALLLLACASSVTIAAEANLIPVVDFARHSDVMAPRLSPDGTYLAVRVDDRADEMHSLVTYRLADMSVASVLRMPKYQMPLNLSWVSPTRLVVEMGRSYGSLEAPMGTGEIIATDVDGKHQDYLYGYQRIGSKALTRAEDKGYGSIDGLPDKANGHFYMGVSPWDNDKVSLLYDVDAVRNTRHLIADMRVYGMNFLMDPDGKAAFAYGNNDEFEFVAYRRGGNRWAPIDLSGVGELFEPIAYAPDRHTIYAVWSKDGGPNALISRDQDGGPLKVLAADGFASVSDLQWTPYPSQPFAAVPAAGIPRAIFINAELPAARLYRSLEKSFPGEFVDFINFSEDGGKLLFEVSSDRDPGTYYLLDTKTRKANRLFAIKPWIKPERMAERRPFRFKASDGMELEGILTLPPKRGETGLPMVLVPHGGPHGPSDDWFYDSDAQFLASRGYLVLQVNYRGSGGRGANFIRAGYLKWGTRIQQDLIDGVKWAMDHHYADPSRICVYGGSFGGYSAMMTVIRAPGLFKCAIGYAGIYDLAMMYKKGDIREDKSGRSYLTSVIGRDDTDLDANSPDKLADKIDVPVLLVHGKADQRAPYAQAEAMRDALKKAHKPYEWMAVPDEGHGFFKEENRVAFLTKMQEFLEKNIGKGAPMQ